MRCDRCALCLAYVCVNSFRSRCVMCVHVLVECEPRTESHLTCKCVWEKYAKEFTCRHIEFFEAVSFSFFFFFFFVRSSAHSLCATHNALFRACAWFGSTSHSHSTDRRVCVVHIYNCIRIALFIIDILCRCECVGVQILIDIPVEFIYFFSPFWAWACVSLCEYARKKIARVTQYTPLHDDTQFYVLNWSLAVFGWYNITNNNSSSRRRRRRRRRSSSNKTNSDNITKVISTHRR